MMMENATKWKKRNYWTSKHTFSAEYMLCDCDTYNCECDEIEFNETKNNQLEQTISVKMREYRNQQTVRIEVVCIHTYRTLSLSLSHLSSLSNHMLTHNYVRIAHIYGVMRWLL